MGRIFSNPKTVKAPTISATPPLPTVSDESGDFEMRKAMRKSGRSKTILTGNLVPENMGKKSVLG